MEQSILKSVKKVLNVGEDDTSFDLDIITFINSAFSTLHQLGVGPTTAFTIEDEDPKWSDFIEDDEDPNRSLIRTYVCMKSRISFDPPTTSFHIAALEKQIQELEVRINTNREDVEWVDPDPEVVVVDE